MIRTKSNSSAISYQVGSVGLLGFLYTVKTNVATKGIHSLLDLGLYSPEGGCSFFPGSFEPSEEANPPNFFVATLAVEDSVSSLLSSDFSATLEAFYDRHLIDAGLIYF